MCCGYLEQVERCAYRAVDAGKDGDVGQSLCDEAVFGLLVERLVDTVSGEKAAASALLRPSRLY